ncbi:MAG: hypothetical protein II610_04975 [Treponema sp.]|nr:hypothetical protein [Treponema sp.]
MLALFAAGCSNSSSAPYIPSGGGTPAPTPAAWDGDLSKLTAESTAAFATATDGMTITGTLGSGVNVKVSIAAGAKVTLKDVTINGTDSDSYKWAGLTCAGDATITLEGTNTLKGFWKYYPGLFVPKGKTLTIKGSGSLNASNEKAAGIGGCCVDATSGIQKEEGSCGTIVIEGGTITATGGANAAGIGCGNGSDCDGVTIKGGTVTATGGTTAAGIGSAQTGSSCGDILISGGTVTATGGDYAAGVGTGRGDNSKCGAITVANTVTKFTATKAGYATNSVGLARAGSTVCGTVTIGGTVYADGIATSPYTYEPNPSPEPGPGPEATKPLTLEFIAAGKITFTKKPASLKYSLDGGATWRAASDSITVSAGDKVGLYANGTGTTSVSNAFKISCDADCYVYGNVMSLEKSSGFSTLLTLEGHNSAFHSLFYENTHIKNHGTEALLLPATTLSQSCYANMFLGCTSLTKAPDLPATTLVERCYNGMFTGCTALTSAPALEAQTLANYCYAAMFKKCTSLTEAPSLPATELKDGCYSYMFQSCNDLTKAPSQLPATTLAKSCYQSMFSNCKKLVTAPSLRAATLAQDCYNCLFENCEALESITCLATDISASNCIQYWVIGVLSNGKFICDSSMVGTWIAKRGDALGSGVPAGWTVEAQQ